ncbi:glutamate receptor 1b isoform X1 [Tachysurus ichikawai]
MEPSLALLLTSFLGWCSCSSFPSNINIGGLFPTDSHEYEVFRFALSQQHELPKLVPQVDMVDVGSSFAMTYACRRKDVKPSGACFTSWSSPACSPRVKLENSPRWMVRRETEDMAKPAGATLCGQGGCSGLARAGSKHLIGNPLGPPDVLNGSENHSTVKNFH